MAAASEKYIFRYDEEVDIMHIDCRVSCQHKDHKEPFLDVALFHGWSSLEPCMAIPQPLGISAVHRLLAACWRQRARELEICRQMLGQAHHTAN